MANHTTNERLVNLHRLVQKLHERLDALENDIDKQNNTLYTITQQQRELKELLRSVGPAPKRSLFRCIFGARDKEYNEGK